MSSMTVIYRVHYNTEFGGRIAPMTSTTYTYVFFRKKSFYNFNRKLPGQQATANTWTKFFDRLAVDCSFYGSARFLQS